MKCIIVLEVPKLAMPNLSSVKIKGLKNLLYMYPGSFTTSLKEINDIKSNLINDPSYTGIISPDSNNFFEKEQNSYSYIVVETKIDLENNAEDILEDLRIFFKPILIIFSFLMSEIFSFNKVYLFRRLKYGYKFIRMLETSISIEEVSNEGEIKRFLSLKDVENTFPFILVRFCNKEKYLEFIDGYLGGKIRSYYISNKISNYWNCLEHFAQRFCKEKGKTRILNKTTIKNLNKIVKSALNLVAQKAIVFPNLDLERVLSRGLLLPSNVPPIFNKIIYMCSRKNISISEEEKRIIKIISIIRNKLYHEETYLTHLVGILSREFGLTDPTLVDIAKFAKKFSLIVERIIFRFFKIIPNYFNLNQNEYFHYLEEKEINLPSLVERRRREKEFLEERFDKSGLAPNEGLIRDLLYEKRNLCRRGKYISLIKYLTHLKLRIQDLTHTNFVSGIFRGSDRSLNVNIRFTRNLKGELEILSRDIAVIEKLRRGEIHFQSDLSNNFHMEFKPLLERTTHSLNANPTGEFLTFLADIKETYE